jgi:hypothetical protein
MDGRVGKMTGVINQRMSKHIKTLIFITLVANLVSLIGGIIK